MPKFIVRWNAGYGSSYDVVDAVTEAGAEAQAYEYWREEVENNADYGIMPYTQDNCEAHDIEWYDPSEDDAEGKDDDQS